MELKLGTLLELAKKNGLGVNPSKDEFVLFIGKYKASSFELPCLDGITTIKRSKILRYNLDSKLCWKRNVESRMLSKV